MRVELEFIIGLVLKLRYRVLYFFVYFGGGNFRVFLKGKFVRWGIKGRVWWFE